MLPPTLVELARYFFQANDALSQVVLEQDVAMIGVGENAMVAETPLDVTVPDPSEVKIWATKWSAPLRVDGFRLLF